MSLTSAAKYADEFGWSVAPAPLRGKSPIKAWKGAQTERLTGTKLKRAFSGVEKNIFIVCGSVSRLAVLDCDSAAATTYWRERLGDVLDETTRATTGRASGEGSHYYFRLAEGEVRKGRSGDDWTLRAEAGGVIGPPSLHASGGRYSWAQARGPDALQDAPAELWAGEKEETKKANEPSSLLSHLLANPPEEGNRNVWLSRVAGHYAVELKHQDAFEETVRGLGQSVGLENDEIEKLIQSIWNAEQAKQAATGLQLICVAIEPREILAQALAAIVKANNPPSIFVRDGKLTRLARDENGAPKLEQMAKAEIRVALERCASFYKQTENGKVIKPAPPFTIESLGALGEWPEIPAVEAIVEAPILRPDGSVLDTPGYDTATRLIYEPSADLHLGHIPEKPTKAQAAAAFKFVREELLADFPFVTPADEANALALLITPIVRANVPLVPLALVDAPKAGSGKGLLPTIGSLIATGREVPVQSMPESEAEWAKVILSQLDIGSTYFFVDEVTLLKSTKLAAALTARVYQDRRLGQTEIVRRPQRLTWAVAGNNIALGGDIPRRCYRIRLDPETSRPWVRTGPSEGAQWRHPQLAAWALEHRGELLTALLTLARAWYAGGQPAGVVPTLGSFEPWAETVGGILTYAGAEGFLGNLTELYDENDEASQEWEEFLRAIASAFEGCTFTSKELHERIERSRDRSVRDALPSELADKDGRTASAKALGQSLRKRLDTRFGEDNIHLETAGKDSRNKSPLWRVVDNAVQSC